MKNILQKIQKPLYFIGLVASALVIVSGLIYSTEFAYIQHFKKETTPTRAACNIIYDLKNSVSDYMLFAGLVLIVIFAITALFGNLYRKKYYISNIICGYTFPVAGVVVALVGIVKNIDFINKFNDHKDLIIAENKKYDVQNLDPITLKYQNMTTAFMIIAIIVFALLIAFVTLKIVTGSKKTAAVVDDLESIDTIESEDLTAQEVETVEAEVGSEEAGE